MNDTSIPVVKKSILVVDDEPTVLRIIEIVLHHAGYEAKCVEDPFECLRLFQERSWDVVLTDLSMPGLNGEDLAATIRARRPGFPVVLLTGAVLDLQRPELFNAVLIKPFTMPVLLEAIGRALLPV